MTYTPNFNNQAFRKRALLALKFVGAVSHKLHKPSWLSCRWIHHKDNFGKSGNPVSDYLKDLLLICVDERYEYKGENKYCKKYIKNRKGILWLRQQLGCMPKPTRQITDTQREELISGKFNYSIKSSRLNHAIQSIPKQQKHEIFIDYRYVYEYDIECCAPRLIHQFAQRCGLDLYLPALQEYIANRSQVRQRLALACEVSETHIKSLVIMLLFGARIQYNPTHPNDIYFLFKGDQARIDYMKQDPYISQLRKDIALCWCYIKPYVSNRTIKTSQGHMRSLPINSKRKSGIYRDLERSIGDVWREYLDKRDIRYFSEHDGFTCEREIDREELINEVYVRTGYEIKFDLNILAH